MTLHEICQHAAKATVDHSRDQHNNHVWCWLLEMLRLWSEANPIRVQAQSSMSPRP